MSKLTALFIDAAHENVDALPSGSATSASATTARARPSSRRAARALLQVLRRPARRDRPDAGDPRGVRADLLAEPAAADAVRVSTRRSRRSASVTTELYPDFNVFEVAKPYARDLMLIATRRSGCSAGRPRRLGARAGDPRGAVPVARAASSRRGTGSSSSSSGTRGWTTRPQARRRLQPARDRARRRRRPDRVEPDRDLRQERAAPDRAARDLARRLPALGVLGVWLLIGVVRSGRL